MSNFCEVPVNTVTTDDGSLANTANNGTPAVTSVPVNYMAMGGVVLCAAVIIAVIIAVKMRKRQGAGGGCATKWFLAKRDYVTFS